MQVVGKGGVVLVTICEAWHSPVKCSRLGLKFLRLENLRNYDSCPVLHLTDRHISHFTKNKLDCLPHLQKLPKLRRVVSFLAT